MYLKDWIVDHFTIKHEQRMHSGAEGLGGNIPVGMTNYLSVFLLVVISLFF